MDSDLERLEKAAKLEKNGNWKELLIFCQEWVLENPRYPGAWQGIGNALRRVANPVEAIPMYLRGIEMAVTYVEDATGESYDAAPLWYQLGHAYYESGSPHKAVEAFLEAASVDPDVADIWNDLGVVYINMSPPNIKAAFDAFSQAYNVDPKNVNSLKNLGIVYAMGDSEPGVQQILRLLSKLNKKAAEDFLLQAKEIMAKHK